MAMIAPFLFVLLLGIFELGMMLRTDIAIANASRTGARVGSSSGRATLADFSVLTALGGALRNVEGGTINWVTIYRVSGSSKTPPANCTNATAIANHGNAASFCNTYSAADVAAVLSNPTGSQANFGCTGTPAKLDAMWCPSTRVIEQASTNGPDYLGIAVSVSKPTSTRLFGSSKTYTDSFVMRLEPTGSLGSAS
jgi:Flp pilus assembly protein TadG